MATAFGVSKSSKHLAEMGGSENLGPACIVFGSSFFFARLGSFLAFYSAARFLVISTGSQGVISQVDRDGCWQTGGLAFTTCRNLFESGLDSLLQ